MTTTKKEAKIKKTTDSKNDTDVLFDNKTQSTGLDKFFDKTFGKEGTKKRKKADDRIEKTTSGMIDGLKKKNYPAFKYWLVSKNITQKILADKTHLSVNTIYRLIHTGKATDSVILLVALCLGLTEKELRELLVIETK